MTDIVQTVESVSYRLEDLKSGTVKVSLFPAAHGFKISHHCRFSVCWMLVRECGTSG